MHAGDDYSLGRNVCCRQAGAPRGLPIEASLTHVVQPQHPLTNTGPSRLLQVPKGDQPAACAVLLCP